MSSERTVSLEHVLEVELERLKRKFNMSCELKVVWAPNGSERLYGEVKDETIFIYDKEGRKALETLKHEFLDYAVSQIIEPYKEVTNKLISLLNEKAYKQKEKLVEKLCKLL